MRMRLQSGKSFSTVFLVLFLILTCGVFMNLKIVTNRILRKKIPGSSIIYLPKGEYLKYGTFGYSSFLADLIYIWAIQYYSDYTILDSYLYLEHIFAIIAELDPLYFDPIDMGAFIAAYEAQDLELAVKILDMGLEKNPKEWFFPYQAAHYIQFIQKDHERAQEYYKKTMSIEGYPPIVRRLYASAIFKAQDYQRALEAWLEIYNSAEDERTKKVASNHLYNIKATMDIEKLQDAVAKYKEKYGRYPADLSRLVSARFLNSIPKDMDDKEYLYDSQTGEVNPPTIPWKR
jgi:tetratricopeptide (TPR) repeat protein